MTEEGKPWEIRDWAWIDPDGDPEQEYECALDPNTLPICKIIENELPPCHGGWTAIVRLNNGQRIRVRAK